MLKTLKTQQLISREDSKVTSEEVVYNREVLQLQMPKIKVGGGGAK